MPLTSGPTLDSLGTNPGSTGTAGGGIQQLAEFFTNPNNLQSLGQLAQTIAQSRAPLPVETARVGNSNLLVDNSKGPRPEAIEGVAKGFDNLIQYRKAEEARVKRKQFLESVKTVMSSNTDNDKKIDALMQLEVQHGTDYGLGLKDIVDQYNKGADRAVKRETSKTGGSVKDQFLGEIASGFYEDKGAKVAIKDMSDAQGRAMRKYGPDYAKKHPEIEEQIQKRFGKDQFGFTASEKRLFKGKPYIYIGNDQWLPEKEYKKIKK